MSLLEDSDLPNILELLETLQLQEVADKYEATINQMGNWLKKRGYLATGIRNDYRKRVIEQMQGQQLWRIAEVLNMSESDLYTFRKRHL